MAMLNQVSLTQAIKFPKEELLVRGWQRPKVSESHFSPPATHRERHTHICNNDNGVMLGGNWDTKG